MCVVIQYSMLRYELVTKLYTVKTIHDIYKEQS